MTIVKVQQEAREALIINHPTFTPLEAEARTVINTSEAAYHLNRKNQTLRQWACLENGPIRPVRINGRLAWNVADIRNLLAGGQ